MPDGAQAWKMIKTPGSHTDRIAQACDRCRSKKIRCDGKRPHCSQCAAVGFECKTSDKLSRRAFPRGYTESLEDRVRQLESENNKLLNLLDIKDEQMEMLAKVESVSSYTSNNNNPSSLPSASPIKQSSPPAKPIDIHNEDANEEEAYVVHQINTLSKQGTYKGSAAGGVFIEAFLEKLKTKNTNVAPLVSTLFENVDAIYQHNSLHFPSSPDTLPTPASMSSPTPISNNGPSTSFYSTLAFPNRMSSDKLTATYFHEWNSMFLSALLRLKISLLRPWRKAPSSSRTGSVFSRLNCKTHRLWLLYKLLFLPSSTLCIPATKMTFGTTECSPLV